MNLVYVETDEFSGLPVRIFHNRKLAYESSVPVERIKCIERALAISQVRRQVFNRQDGLCLRCNAVILWTSGHLHESVSRGQGGEVSLENCEMLCANCHLNGAHGDRRPQFSTKRTEWEPRTR